MQATTANHTDQPQAAADPHPRIARVFQAQGQTALALRESTVAQRLEKLEALRQSLLRHQQAIIDAAAADFGRSAMEAEFTELMPVLMEIGDHRKHLKKWLKPKKVGAPLMMFGTRSQVRYEPRGRCLIISPWNYPVNLTLGPLVPAIASGNAVMIKTSEMSPHFSKVIKGIVEDCFDESEVAIFEGDVSVASALLDLPFDHMFFTGAPSIGKVVMAAAAKHLSSVTLELGGKSPIIIDASADLERAASTIAWGKFVNNGQTCIAPDHIYVHSSVKARFVEILSRTLSQWHGEGSAAQASPHLARIINPRHTARVNGLLQDALDQGATLLYGGATDLDDRFISPTLLGDIPPQARIMGEEIFGPLLPIIDFSELDQVIAAINAQPKPLALYIWSRNRANTERIIAKTSAGGTCINHVMAHFLHQNLPFGGVNNSGIGNYHGEWGIKAFSHERAILEAKLHTSHYFFPPVAEKLRGVLQWLMKRM